MLYAQAMADMGGEALAGEVECKQPMVCNGRVYTCKMGRGGPGSRGQYVAFPRMVVYLS